MINLTFNTNTYKHKNNETVLDTLLRHGVDIAFSCRNGVCHTCLLRVVEGEVNKESQQGLNKRLLEKNYFMPCKCNPVSDLLMQERSNVDFINTAVISEKKMLSRNVCQLFLEPIQEIFYHSGQFINIYKKNTSLMRSYSLASVLHHDYFLELHIKRHLLGSVSRWLVDDVSIGDEIEFSTPTGDCYYQAECNDQRLLLVGTGTGLAPLIGLARAALLEGHKEEIWLYHGAISAADLYFNDELRSLEKQYDNFNYRSCLLAGSPGAYKGSVVDIAFAEHKELTAWLVYLAGDTAIVETAFEAAIKAGVPEKCIYADPFTEKEPLVPDPESQSLNDSTESNQQKQEVDYPTPAPELWIALDNGKLLQRILDGFYDAVYEDPILSPYFENSTKQRAKEKVYSFYRRVFTGEKVYFGDRPRNAHHWMVISDSIFDHREKLLEYHMRKHELSEEMIRKWQKIEELYRPDIVKDKPRGRMIGNIQTPASGFGKITFEVGGLCDACNNEIEVGLEVSYHLRTGQVFCCNCSEI